MQVTIFFDTQNLKGQSSDGIIFDAMVEKKEKDLEEKKFIVLSKSILSSGSLLLCVMTYYSIEELRRQKSFAQGISSLLVPA